MSITHVTKDGLEKLKAQLQYLTTVKRKEIAQQIAEARSQGDLSENAEYDAAKEAQNLLELEISKLEELISNARVIDESNIDTSKVHLLCTVKVRNMDTRKEFKYTIVPETEANLKEGKISVESPIGKGLIGKQVNEVVTITVPAGKIRLKILEISFG
ncbi:MAG: transcription elongation factor GreA [Bacteroidia bacterium]|nr:transcription elongation factor GreA [Bacteroidia bacterium]MDW8348304.1 transcription elongation factor GreA [Bacteroidia bacterium]